jgi:hypothetical protein
MPETTVQGVSLFTKDRGRHPDTFDLALTYIGIEIRRPGESARLLSWERVSEWEIEERRGGVLLTLRGSGSVTPLIIPRWNVDDLDTILRDVTSRSTSYVDEDAPAWSLAPPVTEAPVEAPVMAAPIAVPPTPMPEPLASESALRVEPELEPEPEAESESESEAEVELEAVPEPEPEAESDAEVELEAVPEPELEAVSEPEPEAESDAEVELEAEPEPEPEVELEAVSAHEPAAELEPEAGPETVTPNSASAETETETERERQREREPEPELEPVIGSAASPVYLETEVEQESGTDEALPIQAAIESEPEAEPEAEPEQEAEPAAPADDMEQPVTAAEPEPESAGDPHFEDVVSRILAPPRLLESIPGPEPEVATWAEPVDAMRSFEPVAPDPVSAPEPVVEPDLVGEPAADAEPVVASDARTGDDDVSSRLVWPSDAPLQELSDLRWPSSMGHTASAETLSDEVPEDFILPEIDKMRTARVFAQRQLEQESVVKSLEPDADDRVEPFEPVDFTEPRDHPHSQESVVLIDPVDIMDLSDPLTSALEISLPDSVDAAVPEDVDGLDETPQMEEPTVIAESAAFEEPMVIEEPANVDEPWVPAESVLHEEPVGVAASVAFDEPVEVPMATPTTPMPPKLLRPAIVIRPLEGSVAAPSEDIAQAVPARAQRRRRTRRIPVLRMAATVVLLAMLATAVALVLAQSAGAIHLGFLGPVA